jgi:hypothetical protein
LIDTVTTTWMTKKTKVPNQKPMVAAGRGRERERRARASLVVFDRSVSIRARACVLPLARVLCRLLRCV